jgi:hypothetical protein
MHKTSCVVLLATALIFPGAARAADAKTCDAYVKEATAKAQGIRQFNCGFDGNDPRWTSEGTRHAAWCKTADKEAVERETARRRGEIKLCQTCRAYADLAVAAVADNAKLKCGLEGARWSSKAEDHFGWCMAQRGPVGADEKDIGAAYKAALETMQKPAGLETGARTRATAACKSDQARSRQAESRPTKARPNTNKR